VLRGAEREDALLGARLLFVAPGTAKGHIEAVLVQRLLQALGLHDVGVDGRAVGERIDVLFNPFRVDVHQQFHAQLLAAMRSRKRYISRNFQRVSTCSSGNGGWPPG
jgi:hypothetical protein